MAQMKRKDLLKGPDEFVTTTSSVLVWIKEHPAQFAAGALIILCILAGGYGFSYWKTSREHTAMNEYVKATDDSQLTLKVAQDFSDTKAGKLAKLRLARMAFDQGDGKMALSHANEFMDSWSRKDALHWQAALIIAGTHINQKEPAKAVGLLDECIDSASTDLRDQALFLKASALITLGKPAEARQVLNAVSENYQELAKVVTASLGPLPGAKAAIQP
jgi:predicted negative regulator of RcsB-dependent stress response